MIQHVLLPLAFFVGKKLTDINDDAGESVAESIRTDGHALYLFELPDGNEPISGP